MCVYFHRAIERIYKEYCEQNSKEEPECLNPSDELMWTDSTVWTKVPILTNKEIWREIKHFTLIIAIVSLIFTAGSSVSNFVSN